jgi:DNA-binding SARP family transcriptional activator/tetratricopeptide (TPR) repeat protein
MFALRLLGGLSLESNPTPVPPGAQQRRRLALLAALAMAGERGMARELVQTRLWPESPADRARHALDQLLYATRRDLGRDAVVSGTSELRLNAAVIRPDIWAFDDAVREGRWRDVVALYAGPLLDGIHLFDDADFERCVDAERARRAQEHGRALEALAREAAASGDHAGAVRWWRQAATADPLGANVAIALMRALVAAGDPAAAIRHARVYQELIGQELGIVPNPAVEALAAAIATAPDRGAASSAAAPSAPVAHRATSLLAPPAGAVGPATPTAAPVADEPVLASALTPRRTAHRWRHGVLRPAAFLTAAGALAALLVANRGPRATSPATVAVLPFHASGGQEASQLADGMTVLLTTNLNGAGDLRGVDPRALLSFVARSGGSAPADPRLGDAVADHFGAGLYVLGDVVQVGPRLRMTATLYDRGEDSRAVAQADVEGTTPEFFSLVDRMTAELAAGRQRGPRARLTQLASVTTPSWPALKAYLQGESAMRAGQYLAAVADFQRAVAEDTTFALAYYRLALAASWSDASLSADAFGERAVRFATRLSERDRLLLLAFRAEGRGDGDEAERLYRSILARYPDDVETWFRLGEVLFHSAPLRGRPTVSSRAAFERVVALDPRDPEAPLHLARIAALEDRDAAFDSLAARYGRLGGASSQAWELGIVRRARAGESVSHLADELRGAADGRIYGAVRNLAIYGRDLAAAERLAGLLAESGRVSESRALGHVLTAYLHVARGRLADARAELQRGSALDELLALEHGTLLAVPVPRGPALLDARVDSARWLARLARPRTAPHAAPALAVHDSTRTHLRLYALGLAAARASDTVAAEAYARAVQAMPPIGRVPSLPRDLAQSVRAHAAFHAGRSDVALSLLESAPVRAPMQYSNFSPLYDRAHDRFLRAELLYAAGRTREALAWYQSLGGDSFFDLPYVAPAQRRIAELHELAGDDRLARPHQQRFAALWKDADAALRPLPAGAGQGPR